jgi:hypothetical protein
MHFAAFDEPYKTPLDPLAALGPAGCVTDADDVDGRELAGRARQPHALGSCDPATAPMVDKALRSAAAVASRAYGQARRSERAHPDHARRWRTDRSLSRPQGPGDDPLWSSSLDAQITEAVTRPAVRVTW